MTVHEHPSEAIMAPPAPGELSEDQLAAIRLFNLPDDRFQEELPNFVTSRIAVLAEGTSRSTVTYDTCSFTDFIAPDRPIFPADDVLDQKPFVLDDPSAYELILSQVRTEYAKMVQKSAPDRALINAALKGSFYGQAKYFGSYKYDGGPRLDRIEKGEESSTPGATSVRVIGGAAQCAERAAVAHNGLLMVGVSSKYCIGRLEKYNNGGQKVAMEAHAFLEVLGSDGSTVLYDPSNPKITQYPEKGELIARPNVQKIDPLAGENSYTLDWVRSVVTEDKVETTPDGAWVYYKNTPATTLGHMAML